MMHFFYVIAFPDVSVMLQQSVYFIKRSISHLGLHGSTYKLLTINEKQEKKKKSSLQAVRSCDAIATNVGTTISGLRRNDMTIAEPTAILIAC